MNGKIKSQNNKVYRGNKAEIDLSISFDLLPKTSLILALDCAVAIYCPILLERIKLGDCSQKVSKLSQLAKGDLLQCYASTWT